MKDIMVILGIFVLAIIIVVGVVFFVTQSPQTFTTNNSSTTTNYNTYNTYNNPQNSASSSRADLTEVFLPYFAVLNVSAQCSAHGGAWVQGHDSVGCFGMTVPIDTISTCGSALYSAAQQQCEAVGAHGVCQANNIGCQY